MKLKMYKREGAKKSELGEIRRAGNIPAVLYSPCKPAEKVTIDGVDFKTALRGISPGRLATTQFVLVAEGEQVPVLIKDIQYHPTTYDILHIDAMCPGELVKVRVPIECTGVSDCQGIKLGGFLRQVLRHVLVECPKDQVPACFSLDVKDLVIGQSRRLSDLQIPEGVRPLVDMKEVAVVIAKR
jgi:large subunit ribosomal protein L25